MGFVGTTAQNFLNGLVGMAAFNLAKRDVYLGLSNAATAPTKDGGNFTEPAASQGYKRMKLTAYGGSTTYSPAVKVFENATYGLYRDDSDDQAFYIRNDNVVTMFEECHIEGGGANWGTLRYFGLFDAESGGTPFFIGKLDTPIEVTDGHVALFRKKQLTITHKHLPPEAAAAAVDTDASPEVV